jgi:uncharacterized protein YdiU (UPF0061 family)
MLGFQKSNILLVDSKGVINNQRENLTKEKLDYVSTTHKQTLADAMQGLNIATTEALTLVGSETEVYRENIETGAIVMRTAPSHIRCPSAPLE